MSKPYQPVHHIVFRENIDGITAAAIFLHNHVAGEAYRLYPVRSSKKENFDEMISSMGLNKGQDILVILNFLNHEKSDLWVNHKFDKVIGNRPVRNSMVIYDPEAGCTSKLVQSIASKKPSTKYSDSFIEVIETISKECYRSAYQIFNDTHPVMILRAFLDKRKPDEHTVCRIVELLRTTHMDFKKSMFQAKIGKWHLDSLKRDAESISKSMMVTGKCSTVTQRKSTQYPRYSEFFVNKDLKYAIRFTRMAKDKIYVRVNYNLWHEEENACNIAEMLSQGSFIMKPGGEYDFGGGIIEGKHTERFIDYVLSKLTNEVIVEEEMEKTGVDKENDPVESKAQEMVKAGEVENIDKAREEASSQKEETVKENAEQQ